MSSFTATLFLICTFLFIPDVLSTGAKFDYRKPEEWGRNNPKFATCSTGRSQSPINIHHKDVTVNSTMQPLSRNYHIHNATLVTDGIEVEVRFSGHGSLIIDGKSYHLKQMHWHTPSEHSLNGLQYAAELHQVHVADDGSRTVVATLLKLGPPNLILSKLEHQLDELSHQSDQGDDKHIAIPNFESYLIRRRPRKYYRYIGSVTTPPCDENVIWNVLTKVKTISKAQIDALNAPLFDVNKFRNARPSQPLNGRRIQKYDGY